MIGLGGQLLDAGGLDELAHGCRCSPNCAAIAAIDCPVGVQPVHGLVCRSRIRVTILISRTARTTRGTAAVPYRRCLSLLVGRRGGLVGMWEFAQAAAVGEHAALEVPGQVVPQVPAVGDLHRVRGAEPGGLGVGTGPVPADHLDSGMLLQPGGETGRSRGRGAGRPADR